MMNYSSNRLKFFRFCYLYHYLHPSSYDSSIISTHTFSPFKCFMEINFFLQIHFFVFRKFFLSNWTSFFTFHINPPHFNTQKIIVYALSKFDIQLVVVPLWVSFLILVWIVYNWKIIQLIFYIYHLKYCNISMWIK